MAAETKSKGVKVESVFAPSFHKKVKSKLKKPTLRSPSKQEISFRSGLKKLINFLFYASEKGVAILSGAYILKQKKICKKNFHHTKYGS